MDYGTLSVLIATLLIGIGLLIFIYHINREDKKAQQKRYKEKRKKPLPEKPESISSIGTLPYTPSDLPKKKHKEEHFFGETGVYDTRNLHVGVTGIQGSEIIRGVTGSVSGCSPHPGCSDAKTENAKLYGTDSLTRKADKCIKLAMLTRNTSNIQNAASEYLKDLTEKEIDLRLRSKQGCYMKHYVDMVLPDDINDGAC